MGTFFFAVGVGGHLNHPTCSRMHWKVTLVVGRLLGYSCITKLYNTFFDVQIVYIQYYYAIASFVIACDMCLQFLLEPLRSVFLFIY